jgi:hypothetical protein
MVAVASIAVSCAWPPFLLPTVFVLLGLFLTGSTLLTIVAWNLACLVMLYIYSYKIVPVIAAAYAACYGDIQASYGRFEWIATISAFVVIPLPPTFASVRLYEALVQRQGDWRRVVVSSIAWELSLVPVLICSYLLNLQYKIHQLVRAISGPPENFYSFTNLVLSDLIAWLICTVPVGLAVLWLHEKLGARHLRKVDLRVAEPSPR